MVRIFLLLILLQIPALKAQEWSQAEIAIAQTFSLKRLSLFSDPSNQYLNNAKAIALGKALFYDSRLSGNKQVACASCHLPEKAFSDNKMVALGTRKGGRNVPSLLNVAAHNWFFWDGSKDSLWAQALGSLENPNEHDFSRVELLHFISHDQAYRKQYKDLFNQDLPLVKELEGYPLSAGPNNDLQAVINWKSLSSQQQGTVNQIFTNIGKTIAAYVSTLNSEPTRFDSFLNELSLKGTSSQLSELEQKGFKLFLSQKSGCSNCHSGPLLSNKEFHIIGTGIPAFDNGRSEVIDAVLRDEFNCLSQYSDAKPNQCMNLKYAVRERHVLTGAYKTPSLRSLSKTAPYMHDGRYKDLKAVLNHYVSVSQHKKLDTDLPVIELSDEEKESIALFLLSL